MLSWRPVEVEPINRFFGTHLRQSDFDTIVVPRSWRAVADHLPVPATLIKLSLLMRYTRKVSDGFDVVFGVYNETDFGRRGIQYVHYPTYLRPRPKVDLRWYHPPQAGLDLYYAARRSHRGLLARAHEVERDAGQFELDRRARVGGFSASRRARCIRPSSIRRRASSGTRGATAFSPWAASHRRKTTSA